MTGMTVQDLATKANRPVQDMLELIEAAGLPARGANDVLSADERMTLLTQAQAERRAAEAAAGQPSAAKRAGAADARAGAAGARAGASGARAGPSGARAAPPARRAAIRPSKADVKVRKRRVPVKPPSAQQLAAPEPAVAQAEESLSGRVAPSDADAGLVAVAAPPDKSGSEERAASPVAKEQAPAKTQKTATIANERRTAVEPLDAATKDRPSPRGGRDRARKAAGAKTPAAPGGASRAPAKRKLRPAGDEMGFAEGRARPDDPLDDLNALPDRPTRRHAPLVAPKQMAAHGFKNPGKAIVREVEVPPRISVSELSRRMAMKAADVVRAVRGLDESVQMEDELDRDSAILFVEHLGHKPKAVDTDSPEQILDAGLDQAAERAESLPRPPVVTLMGHVDHGKTSILDRICKSQVAASETGGITQHMGAYHVQTPNGALTFLDTPGHSAFTAMRARGSQVTDVVVLVVAADDGVMPQTEEAVRHVQAAEVPMVVAVNKMDKADADSERVKNELAKMGVVYDGWGGNTQFVEMSATEGDGFEGLLDAVLLQSEMMELSAPRKAPARGVVVEARVDRHRGVVSTLLVKSGTLRIGDVALSGTEFGRVRAMSNNTSSRIKEATPSTLVDMLGFSGVPEAGDAFWVAPKERVAREVAEERVRHRRAAVAAPPPPPQSLEEALSMLEADQPKVLNLVLKSDVRGSAEAIREALEDMGNDEVKVRVLVSGIGGVSESDAHFAAASGAVIIAFNVRADAAARQLIDSAGVDVRYYQLIYEVIEDIRLALSGMLGVDRREEVVGMAKVREVFRSPDFGQVAGCLVVEGAVRAGQAVRVLRDKAVVFTGEIDSLRRFKDDVTEVPNGTECGIGVKNYLNVQAGDELEVYTVREVARELS